MVITIKVGPCRACSFGLCSITERSNDGARPTNIRGRCSSQTRTLPLGARASGPHLVRTAVLLGLKSSPVPASWRLTPLSMN